MPLSMAFDCGHGANKWIALHFHDCVYNWRDYSGFCFGLAAILLWVVAQLPQFISNYKRKSAEALSPWFLAEWLLGDTCNLLGCLLQGQQLPTTTYTAMYFVMSDVVLMFQYIYYGSLQKRKERILKLQSSRRRSRQRSKPGDARHHHGHHHHSSEPGSAHDAEGSTIGTNGGGHSGSGGAAYSQHGDLEAPCGASDTEQHHGSLQQHMQRRSQQQLATGSTGGPAAALQGSSSDSGAQQHQQFITGVATLLPVSKPTALFAVGALVTLGAVSVLVPVGTLLGGGAAVRSSAGAGSGAIVLPAAAAVAEAAAAVASEDPGVDWMYVAGTSLGYCSSVLYLCSRLSQIYKNWQRQSAEGLAITMFMAAASANFCTGTGIALRTFNMEQLLQQAPWLIGSLGTITLDMVILTQSMRYSSKAAAAAGQGQQQEQQQQERQQQQEEEDPLLVLEQPLLLQSSPQR